MSLLVCAACSRHVRLTETACPFCGAEIASADAPERPLPPARLSRAALFAFAAASVGAAACGGTTTDTSGNESSGGLSGVGGADNTGGTSDVGGTANTGGITGVGGNVDGAGGDFPVLFYGAPFPPPPPPPTSDAGTRDRGQNDAAPPRHLEPIYGAPPPPPERHAGGFAFYVPPRDEDPEIVGEDGEDDDVN